MTYPKRIAAALAVGTVLGAASASASAAAIGTAYLAINDLIFSITGDGGATTRVMQLPGDVLPSGSGLRNNGDITTQLNFPTAVDTNSASAQASATGFDLGASSPGGNVGFACVGACSYANNSFAYLTSPANLGPGDGSYAVGDILLEGAIVSIEGAPAGADAQSLAESAVNPNDVGSSDSNVGLQGQFTFTAQDDFDLVVTGAFVKYLRAYISSDLDGVVADAQAGWDFSVSRVLGDSTADDFSYSIESDPDYGPSNRSANAPGNNFVSGTNGDFGFDTVGFLGAGVPYFTMGSVYQVTITHQTVANSEASFTAVPAPGPLGLVALGLFGLAGLHKKRA